jgi:hypothetical protein
VIAQIGIAVFGVLAVWLSQDEHTARRRWAPVFGLLGQPFWVWMAWSGQQWGVLILCALYTVSWARGLRMWSEGQS